MKKALALLLIFVLVFSICSTVALAASSGTVYAGKYGNSCNITLNSRNKDAYVTFRYTNYYAGIWGYPKNQAKIHMYDNNGRYITSWTARNGDRLRLGRDHKGYKLYVTAYTGTYAGIRFYNNTAVGKFNFVSGSNCSIR